MPSRRDLRAFLLGALAGPTGAGDGPSAPALVPHPRNFRDVAWQKAVTDAEIEKAIGEGGAAVGKSPMMPPNADLRTQPGTVQALRMMVRSFGGL
jgi:hypothetical protein